MISLAIVSYFILLVTMFFVKVPNYLPIIIGLGVFFYISFYYFKMKEEECKNTTI